MRLSERLAAAGVVASLALVGCSDSNSTSPEQLQDRSAATFPSTSTTLSETQLVENKLVEMWRSGLGEMRKKFHETGKVDVRKGICAVWQSLGGFTVVVNPAYYDKTADGHNFSFLVFTAPPVDGPEREKVIMMNGAFRYAEVDAEGNLVGTDALALPHAVFSIDGKPQNIYHGNTESVDADLQNRQNGWFLVDTATNTPIAATKIFSPNDRLSRAQNFGEMCRQTAMQAGIEIS